MTPRLLPLLAALALVSLGACDSGDAVDTPTPADVAGVYDVADLRFVPNSPGLRTVILADTLVAGDTSVRLFDGGQATLEFRREGGVARFVPGEFEVRRRQLRLTFDGGNGEALARLLLPQELTFDRDDDSGALSLQEPLTANLEAYDAARYGGFRSVPGTLTFRLNAR